MFPNNKLKALTFSYDDGIEQDRRLIKLFNKYNLKATFNLNSGMLSNTYQWDIKGVCVKRMNAKGLKELYQGHEIAVHGYSHPSLEKLDVDTIRNEIELDKMNLQHMFDCKIRGMAYPFGTCDHRVIQVLKENHIGYGRVVETTQNFDIQTNLLELKASCHHNDVNFMKLAEEFVKLKPAEPKIFSIWGHSYEFDVEDNWEVIEKFCEFISNREDIFYGTNSEVFL
ncbi:MAG TPA: polysaccharide deacetylase [Firmicutes bacterium]|jgi:peptidoglycan-N-acetylglucosamine deacetylase|nr:polysaccharide deacetylase [Bacillota bacterium]